MELVWHIVDKVRSFLRNESGLVQPQKSVALALTTGLVTAAAIILGTPRDAAAGVCWSTIACDDFYPTADGWCVSLGWDGCAENWQQGGDFCYEFCD